MFRVFEGATADQVWTDIAEAFRKGEGEPQPSRVGQMREILHSAMSIANPAQRWVTSRIPSINPAFAMAEVVWIINGRNDSRFLNYFNNQLPKYAGFGATYHGAYGDRLLHHIGFDQLERAYQTLKTKPESRQVVLQIWDGAIDLPNTLGQEASSDVPCNVVSILRMRSGRLEWMQVMRSNDIYRGLPYNIVQFTTIQEVIAGWLGVAVGEYNQISNSLHVYEDDLRYIHSSPSTPAPPNTDSLAFSRKESMELFTELAVNIETIIEENTTADDVAMILQRSNLPRAFKNMLCVLCAEGARRRSRPDVVRGVMLECTNPAYGHLYEQWLQRCRTQLTPIEHSQI